MVMSKDEIRARIVALPAEMRDELKAQWPHGVPSLLEDGHADEQLRTLSAFVAVFEDRLKVPEPVMDKNRARIHGACTAAFGNDDDLRHALIRYATTDRSESSRNLDDVTTQLICDAADKIATGMLVFKFDDYHGNPYLAPAAEPPTPANTAEHEALADADFPGSFQSPAAAVNETPEVTAVTVTAMGDAVKTYVSAPTDWKQVAQDRGVTQAVVLRQLTDFCGKYSFAAPKRLADCAETLAELFLSGRDPDAFNGLPTAENPNGALAEVPVNEHNHVVAPDGALVVVHLGGSFVTGFLNQETAAKVLALVQTA